MSDEKRDEEQAERFAELTRREALALGGVGAAALLAETSGLARAATATPKVPRRVLGKTGKDIPILLFGGAVSLNPRFDPKLAEAFRYGVDYIDAADCYSGGRCEPAVGSFLAKSGLRDKIWITSKGDQHEPAAFVQTFEKSLQQLGTNYINLYFLHALQDAGYLSDKLQKEVAALKKSGKLKFFGFSCHDGNVVELLERAAKLPWVDAVMFRFNFRRYGDKELNRAMDAAHKSGVGLIAMKTQGSEFHITAGDTFVKQGKWNKYQAVLKSVWQDKRITAAVSHMDTLERLRENIAAALDKKELTRLEQESLDRYARATQSLTCDGCDHLCGAHIGAPLKVGHTLRYLGYHDVYGETEKAKRLFAQLPPEARQLPAVDLSRASAACPNGVDLALHLKRAFETLA